MESLHSQKWIVLHDRFRKIIEFTSLILLILFMLIGFGPTATYGQGDVDVYGNPAPVNVTVGDDFTLTLQIDPDGGSVTAVHIVMDFNPALFQVNSLTLASGNPLGNELPGTVFDNTTGYLSIASYGLVAASNIFNYATISCTALASGSSNFSFIRTGNPKTLFGYAQFDVTGSTDPITVNISPIFDCPALGVDNGEPCSVGGQSGEYVNCECLVYDCQDVPGGGAIIDNCGNCVGGSTGEIPCVSGSVDWNSNCGERNAAVRFYMPGTATEVISYAVSVQDDGSFSIPSPESGTFDVIVKVDGYLAKGIPNVEIGADENNLVVGSIVFGDFDNSNIVDFIDFGILSGAFLSQEGQPTYNPVADSNCDGLIDFADFGVLSGALLMIGDTAPLSLAP